MVCKTTQRDKELNTLLNDKIFVSLRDLFNVFCQTNMATLQVQNKFLMVKNPENRCYVCHIKIHT